MKPLESVKGKEARPDKIEEIDLLRWRCAQLESSNASLLANQKAEAVTRIEAEMGARYQITKGDSVDSKTGKITRHA